MALIKDYFEYQDEYEKKYGSKTIVLMEVGSFIEIYGIETDKIKKGRISEIVEITGWTKAIKKGRYDWNKGEGLDPELDGWVESVLMAGFPNYTLDKWKEFILKKGYTVIIIEQDSHGTKGPNRNITEIVSPGTNINNNTFTNNLMSIYLEEMKDWKTQKPILGLGLSVVDVSTGKTFTYETHSTYDDYKYSLDEIFRFIQSHSPKEILLHSVNVKLTKEELVNYLEISQTPVHYNFYSDRSELLKPSYRDFILNKVFSIKGSITATEYIGLDKSHTALISFVYLLQFAYDHNENIIRKIIKPKLWESDKFMVLSHDSINQLNIVKDRNKEYKNGISSLWDILDKTVTCLGKRYLKYKLLNPILDKTKLNHIYNTVELLQNNSEDVKLYNIIQNELKLVSDIERFHRKMAIHIINPQDFISLDIAYKKIITTIGILKDLQLDNIDNEIPAKDIELKFKEYITDYTSKIEMKEIMGVYQGNIIQSFFKKGIYDDIDVIQDKIDYYHTYFEELSLKLGKIVDPNGNSKFDIRSNDKEGHYITTTKSRAKLLQKYILKNNIININIKNNKKEIKLGDLEFKYQTGNVKINSPEIKQNSHSWIGYQEKIKKACLHQFSILLQDYHNKYAATLESICHFVSRIDFLCCIAKVSKENCYTKPQIVETENSFIEATDMRHPIIEKIREEVKYIPNDVLLGKDEQNGILLYGVNAVGKSSYMKSIGISIIMAQAGFFVSARNFKYSPYKYLFTRISSNDNIFKGQSTFAVEMSELRAILKRTNKYSLVLGDELCSGTETTSGLSIVTAGVMRLCEKKSSFVFATHLHQLSEMEEIKECGIVKNYHMETTYNEEKKQLIYNRKLKEGSGSSIYGLEVAKAMGLDKDFIDIANKVRKKLMNIDTNIVNNKQSVYNSKIIMDTCMICKHKVEEVHHIQEQHLANSDGIIDNFHKNNMFNLVQLCHKCHHDVHHGNLNITGYIDTSDGIELVYNRLEDSIVEEIKKRKYNKDQINIIKDIYKKTGIFTTTRKILSCEKQIDISIPTIKKIINNNY